MSNRVAVVTGANKGLGYSIVKGLCKKFNGTVYLTARDEKRGMEAIENLKSLGYTPEFHQLDVTDEESVKKFADFIKTKHSGFDVLVNNAAILEWDEIYPDYDTAKRNIDTNYKSLLTVEKYLFPLLRDGARVVNVSSACGLVTNLRNKKWINILTSGDLSVDQLNNFVEEYLESVKNGTFNKNDFADDGKHAEHRVSKIAVIALTMIQQQNYSHRNISINAVNPGHVKTDMAHGGGTLDPDEAANTVLYLIFDASPNLRGVFLWDDKKLIDWYDTESECYCKDLW